MTTIRFWLCPLLLLSLNTLAYTGVQHSKRDREAKHHLNRAGEFHLRDDPRAEQEYRLAIKVRGGYYPKAYQKLSWYLQQQLRFSEAAEALQAYVNQTPRQDHIDDLRNLERLRRASLLQARISSSEKPELEEFLEFVSLVDGYGKSSDAVPYAERAVNLYPISSKAYVLLARLLKPEQKERAFKLLQKAVGLDPHNPEVHSALGWYYFVSGGGRLKEAVEEFRKALELSGGEDASAWQGLGHLLALKGEKREAIEAFRNYLRTRKVPTQYDEEVKRLIEKLENDPRR